MQKTEKEAIRTVAEALNLPVKAVEMMVHSPWKVMRERTAAAPESLQGSKLPIFNHPRLGTYYSTDRMTKKITDARNRQKRKNSEDEK